MKSAEAWEVWFEQNKEEMIQTADDIFRHPELSGQEVYSSGRLAAFLEKQGFSIQWKIAGFETAFIAQWGSNKPVIGYLAEYDALPGLGQEPVSECRTDGGPGHGCGHNLLGTACAAAACALKAQMEAAGVEGTIRVYGCPAEEIVIGKIKMNEAGVFDDLSAAVTWHPFDRNRVSYDIWQAQDVKNYAFYGTAAHAAKHPELGRSALDAAELMNVGVNYLREHMIPEARVHYAVTNSGGEAPNVVPAYAQVLYSVRAPGTEELHKLIKRVSKVAEGAAMMTETKVEIRVVSAYSDVLQNKTLDQLVFSHIREIYPLKYTEEEMVCAEKFHKVGDPGDWKTYQGLAKQFYGEKGNAFFRGAMADTIFPPVPVKMGSTDVGDVSWTVPTAWFGSACYALGTPAHSWLAVAQGKSGIAKRGMEAAASVIARTTLDIMENPQIAKKAREDMEKAKNGFEYHSVIPAEVQAGAF